MKNAPIHPAGLRIRQNAREDLSEKSLRRRLYFGSPMGHLVENFHEGFSSFSGAPPPFLGIPRRATIICKRLIGRGEGAAG